MSEEERWMREAVAAAEAARDLGEVPVGAVIVKGDEAIATGHNLRETRQSPIEHAEIVAIRRAARRLGSWRLEGCDLYVTLEPCPMCAGALVLSRIRRLVFGAHDPKSGFCGSLENVVRDPRLNHQIEVQSGVLRDRCAELLREFFRTLRKRT